MSLMQPQPLHNGLICLGAHHHPVRAKERTRLSKRLFPDGTRSASLNLGRLLTEGKTPQRPPLTNFKFSQMPRHMQHLF